MIREKTIFRNFLFGAVLLAGTALAVSCSVDEATSVSDTNAISFRTEFTRATATTINTLNEFTVWGWKTDVDGAVTGTLMNGVTAVNSGNGTYETAKTYYWPGCSVDFLAVSPLATTVDDTNGKVYIGENVTQTEIGENGSETFEGYFAEATLDAESGRIETLSVHVPAYAADQADLLYAYTPKQSTGKVPMNFRHALSQVEFKALNTNSLMTVVIDGVKVASVANHGELTFPTEATSATNGAYGAWTPAPVYNLTEYSAGLPSEAVTIGSEATTLTADGGSLFLIPQECVAWEPVLDETNDAAGAYFLISCRIEQLGVEIWPGTGTCAEIAIPCEIAWEQGKKYTYTFFFGDGAGYYPPTDGSNPGNPILGNPIHFIFDVEDFDGVTDDEYVEIDDILPYLIDENFQAYAAANFDFDGNGHVSSAEAATVTSIHCGNYPNNAAYNYPEVKDFTGIEYFTALTSFESNTAVTLDLSSNTELTTLHLGHRSLNDVSSSDEYPEASPLTTLDLSKNTKITSFGEYAFKECANLETITLPSTLTSIGSYCFLGCSSLTNLGLPNGLTSIGSEAFQNCTSLTLVNDKIPDTVTSIDNGQVFYGSGLKAVIWTSGVATLPRTVFSNCTSLTTVTLPETVTSLSTNAFLRCSALTTMTIYATTPPSISGSFSNASKFDLYVPAESIEAYKESSWASYYNNIYAIED